MRYLICALALSFGVAQAEVVNTVNDGAVINGGNYLNTPGHETLFTNNAGTGITLNAGQTIRGFEFSNGAYTGNGGSVHIQAPDQVVRLNGNIDVRGFLPNSNQPNGGNGGNVTVDAAYLYQNGNIYASGTNGGNVQFNVGGATVGGLIDASGRNGNMAVGNGGSVSINSTGQVDLNGMINTTAGNQAMTPLTNNIVIVGHGVNMNGTMWAGNGGGAIKISSTGQDADVTTGKNSLTQAEGGTIVVNSERDINQNGTLLANGIQSSNSGSISLTAVNAIHNAGRLQADGAGTSQAGGTGGNGGAITLSANSISNDGVIRSFGGSSVLNFDGHTITGKGGQGGSVTFIGANPTGSGVVATFGGVGAINGSPLPSNSGSLGTITAANPAASSNLLFGVWKKSQ